MLGVRIVRIDAARSECVPRNSSALEICRQLICCRAERSDNRLFLIGAMEPSLRHGQANCGRDLPAGAKDWNGEANPARSTLFPVYREFLKPNVLIFPAQILLVGDGLIGKSVDFEAPQQSFPLNWRLKRCD